MKKSVVSGITALVLAGAITITAGIGSSVNGKWFKNSDIKTWFNSWGKDKQETVQPDGTENKDENIIFVGALDSVGKLMSAKTVNPMPESMTFFTNSSVMSAGYSPTVTVTCSHDFEYNNIFVDWTVESANGASAAEYITVTPASDGSLTAEVTCLSPFSNQLTLKATLRGEEEKYAMCTVNYVKRVSRLSSVEMTGTAFEEDSGFSVTPVFGIGSVDSDLSIQRATHRFTDEYIQLVKKYLKFDIVFTSCVITNISLSKNSGYTGYGDTFTEDMFIEDFDDYDSAHIKAIHYALDRAYSDLNGKGNITVDLTISQKYNGVVVDTYNEYNYTSNSCFIFNNYNLSPDLSLNAGIAF